MQRCPDVLRTGRDQTGVELGDVRPLDEVGDLDTGVETGRAHVAASDLPRPEALRLSAGTPAGRALGRGGWWTLDSGLVLVDMGSSLREGRPRHIGPRDRGGATTGPRANDRGRMRRPRRLLRLAG